MTTLWRKQGIDVDPDIFSFTTDNDNVGDEKLIPYDIIGSIAHVLGLKKIGVLSETEADNICNALRLIHNLWSEGSFKLKPDDEDVHSAIERALVEKLGDTGKKVHTGRSRNDQILTDMRLIMKDRLLDAAGLLEKFIQTLCNLGIRFFSIPLPGYTHGRRAMPSTVGFWYASFADSLTETLVYVKSVYDRIDESPLGAAAGFGVPLALDREYTAKLMGFDRVQINAAAVGNSRGRFERAILDWFCDMGLDIEKMAWDLLIFSTTEYGFVKMPESFCTGSSIMPQKKNADCLELLRAAPSSIRACRNEIEHVIEKLPSNYHRDFQLTKTPFFHGFERGCLMLKVSNKILPEIEWDNEMLRRAITPDMFAVHRALELVNQGIPFRDAYQKVYEEITEGKAGDWDYDSGKILSEMRHLGAPANPGLKEASNHGAEIRKWIEEKRANLDILWKKLLKQI